MKKIVRQIYTYILLIFNVFYPKFVARNTLFWTVKITNKEKGEVKLKKAYLHKTKIKLSGQKHKISVEGAIYNSVIEVYGTNNKIIFDEGSQVHDATIILRGNDLLFYIGKCSAIGGGRFIIMGQSNHITIGMNCMLSDHLQIWSTDSHPIYDADMNIINPSAPIIVNDGAWIGSCATVLKGVTIGEGAIIGMNSVVTRDIPAHSICVGNPAKVVKSNVTWRCEYINI